MAYSAEISRTSPTCFLFLLDQSGSMNDSIGGSEVPQRKADVVADALNRLLSNIAIRCAREDGVRDYFHVAVLGYGATVGPALAGPLGGRDFIPMSQIAASPVRVEDRKKKVPDGAGGLVEQSVKFPIWVQPTASGGTPMSQALTQAENLIRGWLDAHPTCFPPVILNLTDGESTDGDPSAAAAAIQARGSVDGNVMLFNLHVSSGTGAPIAFPSSDSVLPDQFARLLFTMSSVLPDAMRTFAQQQGYAVTEGARGFVFNGRIDDIVQFLDIGTRASGLR